MQPLFRFFRALPRPIKICGVFLLIIIVLFFYSLWEYKNIGVKHLSLPENSKLAGIKIVYASDFQYDTSFQDDAMQHKMFQKAIQLIQDQKADLILLGGDYLTYPVHRWKAAQYLSSLSAPLGVYGVFGNHDARAKDDLLAALDGKITFLENDSALLSFHGATLSIYGTEDLWAGNPKLNKFSKDADYSILMTHNPDFIEEMSSEEKARFDLIISGHIHAGQITFFGFAGVPFVLDRVTSYGEKYRYGKKERDGQEIYITSGLGGHVFGIPIRFGARPEIVVMQ